MHKAVVFDKLRTLRAFACNHSQAIQSTSRVSANVMGRSNQSKGLRAEPNADSGLFSCLDAPAPGPPRTKMTVTSFCSKAGVSGKAGKLVATGAICAANLVREANSSEYRGLSRWMLQRGGEVNFQRILSESVEARARRSRRHGDPLRHAQSSEGWETLSL